MNRPHSMESTIEGPGPLKARSGARGYVAWTSVLVLVVTVALVFQTIRLHHRDSDLGRREQSLAEMKALVTQLQKTNDAREKRLHEVADSLEEMYRLMRSQMSSRVAPEDPGVRQVGHSSDQAAPVPDLMPTGR